MYIGRNGNNNDSNDGKDGSSDIKNNASSSYNTNKCSNGGICLFLRFNKRKKKYRGRNIFSLAVKKIFSISEIIDFDQFCT